MAALKSRVWSATPTVSAHDKFAIRGDVEASQSALGFKQRRAPLRVCLRWNVTQRLHGKYPVTTQHTARLPSATSVLLQRSRIRRSLLGSVARHRVCTHRARPGIGERRVVLRQMTGPAGGGAATGVAGGPGGTGPVGRCGVGPAIPAGGAAGPAAAESGSGAGGVCGDGVAPSVGATAASAAQLAWS
jgi:hypothetical protein